MILIYSLFRFLFLFLFLFFFFFFFFFTFSLSCVIELSGNSIGTKGADALSDALIANSTLRCLELKKCEIPTDGVVSIANALRLSNALQELNLAENVLADPGVK